MIRGEVKGKIQISSHQEKLGVVCMLTRYLFPSSFGIVLNTVGQRGVPAFVTEPRIYTQITDDVT